MNSVRIDICVATFKRPALLADLINSLLQQNAYGFKIRLIVVDNDIEKSAESIVKTFTNNTLFEIIYDLEPNKGISYARNRAINLTDADYIAFLDDDEMASPLWLKSMWLGINKYEADIIFGPVLGILPENAPQWAKQHPSFNRPRKQSGTVVKFGASGNVLIRRTSIEQETELFDPKFSLTGGEDTDFFYRLFLAGKRLVWCDEAVVYEHVPLNRISIGWVCSRAFRGGQSAVRVFVSRYSIYKKLIWFIQKPLQIAFATIMLPFIFPMHSLYVKVLCRICSALGQYSALLGKRFYYKEYK